MSPETFDQENEESLYPEPEKTGADEESSNDEIPDYDTESEDSF